MSALLARLVAAQKAGEAAASAVPLGCLAKVLRAFGGTDGPRGAGQNGIVAVPGLVEQLTAREQEILVCWPRASSERPTAPRPSPGPASSAWSPSARTSISRRPSPATDVVPPAGEKVPPISPPSGDALPGPWFLTYEASTEGETSNATRGKSRSLARPGGSAITSSTFSGNGDTTSCRCRVPREWT